MNVLIYRVSLDMFDTLSQITIKAKKCDSACQIHITLTEKGKIYKIGEGCYATFNAKKSDGNFVYDKCTIEDNAIVYDFTSSIDENGVCQISAFEGIVECEVTLYNANSNQLTSPRFTLFIDGTVYNGEEVMSTPEANALKELIVEANKTVDEVERKLENGEFVGAKGDKGEQGIQGEKGDKGDKGDKGEVETDSFASAIKNTLRGETLTAKDVSPVEHNLKVKLANFCEGETLVVESGGTVLSDYPLLSGQVNFSFDVTEGEVLSIALLRQQSGFTTVGEVNFYKSGKHYTGSVEVPNDGETYCLGIVPNTDGAVLTNLTISSNKKVTVSRYGKNLSRLNSIDVSNYTINASGVPVAEIKDRIVFEGEIIGDFILSGVNNTTDIYNKTSTLFQVMYINADGIETTKNVTPSAFFEGFAFSGTLKKIECKNWCYGYGGSYGDIQLEVGVSKTTFEPYKEPQTATANADGTVEGLTSVSPNMTVFSNTEGVVINLEYNADTKMYIDNELAKIKAELSAAILNS